MTEFERINAFFQHGFTRHRGTLIANGDDASQIKPPSANHTLVQSIDTQVAGVHFPIHASAQNIAERSLRAALSDIIAMGARPSMMHLALTLTPQQNDQWLESFASAIKTLAQAFQLELLGGDTTSGSQLALSWQVQGWLEGHALRRSGAGVDDDVWLSQTPAGLGAAHLALPYVLEEKSVSSHQERAWVEQYYRPALYPELGTAIADLASACLDVSDGLIQDATHIAQQSQVDIHLNARAVRTAVEPQHANWLACFNGGDDYQLLFCAPKAQRQALNARFIDLGLEYPPQRIGHCQARSSHQAPSCMLVDENGQTLTVPAGYQHTF